MAASFTSIPLEIRLKIYGYLLGDWENHGNDAVKIYDAKHEGGFYSITAPSASEIRVIPRYRRTGDFRFQNAILCTSYQIYNEAITVLYGKNIFWYSCPSNNLAVYGVKAAKFPQEHLRSIRYLRLQVMGDFRGYKLHQFVDPITVISHEVQTLVALNLIFCFEPRCPIVDPKEGLKPLPDAVSSSSEILEAIAAIDVHQEIQINVLDKDWETTMEAFNRFAQSIAVKKSWHIEYENGDDDPKEEPTRENNYRWTWKLRPSPNTFLSAQTRRLNY